MRLEEGIYSLVLTLAKVQEGAEKTFCSTDYMAAFFQFSTIFIEGLHAYCVPPFLIIMRKLDYYVSCKTQLQLHSLL